MKIKTHSIILVFLICSFSLKALPKQETIGEWNNELLLRSERTTGLPGGREDLERTQLTILMELTAPVGDNFSFGISIRANKSTDDPANNLVNLDNSESNIFELDQSYLDWNFSESGFFRIGKNYLPTNLSTMVWDKDIPLTGLNYVNQWINEEENEFEIAFGAVKISHFSFDEVSMFYGNIHYTMSFGDVFITLGGSGLVFKDTDLINSSETLLRRTNSDNAFLEDFEIVMFDLSFNFDLLNQSISLGFEAGQNIAVDDNNQMKRVNFVIGNNQIPGGLQFNLHYQDIERDAAVAAFNDDDWWFATWTKGYRVSTSYGITEDTFVQISYFNEEWRTYNTKRIFLELRSFF